MKNYLTILAFSSVLLFLTFSCNNQPEKKTGESYSDKKETCKGDLIIFHAGSLAMPVKQISDAFKKENPDINILAETAGSVASARKITDLGKKCDVFISADYNVINNMLIPKYTDWNIKFAGNEMALIFNDNSKYSNQINEKNWYDILLKKDVRIGRADPNSDPCGYRTVLTTKLAEKFYKKPNVSASLLSKNKNYMRPKEVDLLALLETGSVDYIFMYRSVAVQHNLKFIKFPDEINLKNPDFSDLYATENTEISGEKPGETKTIKGEPISYGITILNDAPNKKTALAFVSYFLSPDKGMSIMIKNGQTSLTPSFSESYNKIPKVLSQFAKNIK